MRCPDCRHPTWLHSSAEHPGGCVDQYRPGAPPYSEDARAGCGCPRHREEITHLHYDRDHHAQTRARTLAAAR